MNKELKPCPFCGSADAEVEQMPANGPYVVVCTCGCGMFGNAATKEDAIKDWNTRSSPWIKVSPDAIRHGGKG